MVIQPHSLVITVQNDIGFPVGVLGIVMWVDFMRHVAQVAWHDINFSRPVSLDILEVIKLENVDGGFFIGVD